MAKTDVFEEYMLTLIFRNEAPLTIGGGTGVLPSNVDGFLAFDLLTADSGEAGASAPPLQVVNYGGYAAVNVPRNASQWAYSGGAMRPLTPIDFPVCTSGSTTATHVCISSNGIILYRGAITPSIVITAGISPRIGTGSAITED